MRLLIPLVALCLATSPASGKEGVDLRARHGELQQRLDQNPFGRPLAIDSHDADGALRGDVHARLDYPFPRIRDALADASSWCQVLTLPFNVQKCEARGQGLSVFIGRKPDSPIDEATRLDLKFHVAAKDDEQMQVELTSPAGPAGTRDYRIVFAAVPLDDKRTFVHMTYGYRMGAMSSIAMQTYLATSGADKVGFSSANGSLVGGMRGVLERNTMRYFLAIDSYLATLGKERRARLEHWFASTEKYPRQLHEMTREQYLQVKQAAG